MQRLTKHHLFEQEDTFDILFQFLYFFSVGCFMFVLLKSLLVLKIYFILSFWDGIYFIMSVLIEVS